MTLQLPTGRSIQLTIDEYLELTDDDIQGLIAYEQGFFINQPFLETCLIDLIEDDSEDETDWEEQESEDLFTREQLSEMLLNDSFGHID